MSNMVQTVAEAWQKLIKNSRRCITLMIGLALIVALSTIYALALPAHSMERDVICGKEAHTHTDKCYETIVTPEDKTLACEIGEHIHSDACYETTKTLVCGLEENEEHTHTDACYEITKTLVCTTPEHTHSDDCYKVIPESTELVLVCTEEEHEHIDSCYPAENKESAKDTVKEKKADTKQDKKEKPDKAEKSIGEDVVIENSSDWEQMFKDVKLSGNWGDDIVTIANTQYGYKECKGGYTRYGGWYGIPCGDWCAMFASFCMNYAGVKDFPFASNCQEWIEILKSDDVNLYHSAKHALLEKKYIPKPGDLVFFDWDGSGISDHVGIVTEYIPAHGTMGARISTIEGNMGDRVAKLSYSYNSEKILGFGQIPLNPASYVAVDGISMDVEYNEINSSVIFSADIGDIEQDAYKWHWERSIDNSESWEAISGADELVCDAALDEYSADALYRICGISVDADDESKKAVNIASYAENAIPESSDYLFMNDVFDLGNQPELEKTVPSSENNALTAIPQLAEQQKVELIPSGMLAANNGAENEGTADKAANDRVRGHVFKYMPNGINTRRHPMRGHLLDNSKLRFFDIKADAICVEPIIVCAFSFVMILLMVFAVYSTVKHYKSKKIRLYSIDDIESLL